MFKIAEDPFFDRRKHDLQYANYMIKHKAGVADAGVKLNLPLSTILKHDWSKFKPDVWTPHREYFYGSTGVSGTNDRDTFLNYKNSRVLHFKYEPGHHGLNKTIDGELESVADWYAVGKANAQLMGQPYPTFRGWWIAGRNKYAHQLSQEAYDKVNQLVAMDIDLLTYLLTKSSKEI